MVAAWAWGAYLGEEGMKRGIRVKTSSFTRHHVNITMTQAKAVSNYTNSILANMEATDDGYDEAPAARRRRLRVGRRGREPLRHQERRGLHARPRPAPSTASPATPSSTSARISASRWWKSASPATRSTSATRPFFTGTAAEVTPSENSTASRSASVHAAPSPRRSRRFFDIVGARTSSTPIGSRWLTLAQAPALNAGSLSVPQNRAVARATALRQAHCAHWRLCPASAPGTCLFAASSRKQAHVGRLGGPALARVRNGELI